MRLVVSGNIANIIAPIDRLPARAKRAMGEGLKQGGNKVRTKVRRALKKQVNTKSYGAIVQRTHSYAPVAALKYTITGSGIPIKIPDEIPTRARAGKGWMRWSRWQHWKLQSRAGGRWGPITKEPKPEVRSRPWAVSHLFKRSFVAPSGLKAAIPGGSGKWRFRRLYGPNVAKEIVKGQSAETFKSAVQTDVLPPIMRRLARVMP